jgi:hypothetical protein
MADEPTDQPAEDPRQEMRDAPPFLTWNGIYLLVVGALAAQIILYGAVTIFYR